MTPLHRHALQEICSEHTPLIYLSWRRLSEVAHYIHWWRWLQFLHRSPRCPDPVSDQSITNPREWERFKEFQTEDSMNEERRKTVDCKTLRKLIYFVVEESKALAITKGAKWATLYTSQFRVRRSTDNKNVAVISHQNEMVNLTPKTKIGYQRSQTRVIPTSEPHRNAVFLQFPFFCVHYLHLSFVLWWPSWWPSWWPRM